MAFVDRDKIHIGKNTKDPVKRDEWNQRGIIFADAIDDNQEQIDELETEDGVNKQAISDLENLNPTTSDNVNTILDLGTRMDTVETTVNDDHTPRIVAVEVLSDQNETDIATQTALLDDALNLEPGSSNLVTQVLTNVGDIGDNVIDITQLRNDVDLLQAGVQFKGVVDEIADLPAAGNVIGDMYLVTGIPAGSINEYHIWTQDLEWVLFLDLKNIPVATTTIDGLMSSTKFNEVEDNSTRSLANEGDIGINASAIAIIDGKTDDNAAAIVVNEGRLDTTEANTASNLGLIQDNQLDILTNVNELIAHDVRISQNAEDIEELQIALERAKEVLREDQDATSGNVTILEPDIVDKDDLEEGTDRLVISTVLKTVPVTMTVNAFAPSAIQTYEDGTVRASVDNDFIDNLIRFIYIKDATIGGTPLLDTWLRVISADAGDILDLQIRMTTAEGDIIALEGRMDIAEPKITALEAHDIVQDGLISDNTDAIGVNTNKNVKQNTSGDFITSPIVPAPAGGTSAVNQDYVDNEDEVIQDQVTINAGDIFNIKKGELNTRNIDRSTNNNRLSSDYDLLDSQYDPSGTTYTVNEIFGNYNAENGICEGKDGIIRIGASRTTNILAKADFAIPILSVGDTNNYNIYVKNSSNSALAFTFDIMVKATEFPFNEFRLNVSEMANLDIEIQDSDWVKVGGDWVELDLFSFLGETEILNQTIPSAKGFKEIKYRWGFTEITSGIINETTVKLNENGTPEDLPFGERVRCSAFTVQDDGGYRSIRIESETTISIVEKTAFGSSFNSFQISVK